MSFKDYNVVALTEKTQAIHKETQPPIQIIPGQVGTIIMDFDGRAYLVYFADSQGKTYAIETLLGAKLILLINYGYSYPVVDSIVDNQLPWFSPVVGH